MPLYEYRCEACGEKEEKLESFSAPVEHACAKCGSPSGMKRQISTTAFALSGDGWYSSGYSAGGSKPAASEAPKPAAAPSGGSCCAGCPHAH